MYAQSVILDDGDNQMFISSYFDMVLSIIITLLVLFIIYLIVSDFGKTTSSNFIY